MARIVLDTNSLIQSIPPRSKYHHIWKSFLDGTNVLCISTEILEEYEEILQRLTDIDTAQLVIELIINNPYTLFLTPYYKFNLIAEDPDDNKFVDCAIAANAKYIVSEDRHFDVLKACSFPKVDVIGLDLFANLLESKPYTLSDASENLVNEPMVPYER